MLSKSLTSRTRRNTIGAIGASWLAALAMAVAAPAAATTLVDFEDVGATLPSPCNPLAEPGPDPQCFYNGSDFAGDWTSNGQTFSNSFTDFGGGFTAWDGWSYSQMADTATPGIANQYSAVTGSGVHGSDTYAVGFPGGGDLGSGVSTITLDSPTVLSGAWITNTTYAALSMRDGDAFAKMFGGPSDDDPDFFRLTIQGLDSLGDPTDTVEFHLADFRFADNDLDFIVDRWHFVDLSSLGQVSALDFTVDGSDVGDSGLNTPAYFALDNLIVPEPGSAVLLAGGLLGVAWRRRLR